MFDLLLINVSGMSLFPFDIAKIRQYSEQNKLFADFRRSFTCDTAAHLRQSAEIAPPIVASVANRFPFEIVVECEQS